MANLAMSQEYSLGLQAAEPTGIEDRIVDRRSTLALGPAGPNPFTSRTLVSFDLPQPAYVTIASLDVRGRRARQRLGQEMSAGRHDATWSGRDDPGAPVAPGIYFMRVTANDGRVGVARAHLLR